LIIFENSDFEVLEEDPAFDFSGRYQAGCPLLTDIFRVDSGSRFIAHFSVQRVLLLH
jgi:hypothetical protein